MAKGKYRLILDGTDAYKQIRIVLEHVKRSVVTTPADNMVSLVVQQGDCNAPATYQALMNHIFGPYLGRFMDVYLDDIIVFSKTEDQHIQDLKQTLSKLRNHKLYSKLSKCEFFKNSLIFLLSVVTLFKYF